MNPNRRCATLLAAVTLPTVLALGVTAGAVSGASAAYLEVSAAPLQTWKITHGLRVLPEAPQDVALEDVAPGVSASSPDPAPSAPEDPRGTPSPSGQVADSDASGDQPPSTSAAPAKPSSPKPAEAPAGASPAPSSPSGPPGSGDSTGPGVVGTGAGPDLGPDLASIVPLG